MHKLLLTTLAVFVILFGTAHAAFGGNCPGAPTPIATGIVTLTYTDSAVSDGVTYHYGVTAVQDGIETSCSNVARAVIPATGTHTVSLSWQDSCPTCTFNLYRIVESPAPINFTGTVN